MSDIVYSSMECPSPQDFLANVNEIQFFFLMSPEYGETASFKVNSNLFIIIEREGRIRACMPNPHVGEYNIVIRRSGKLDERLEHLSEETVNFLLRGLASDRVLPNTINMKIDP